MPGHQTLRIGWCTNDWLPQTSFPIGAKMVSERSADMDEGPLTTGQSKALSEIKRRVKENFPVVDFVLYGSAARGVADEESDLDLLIITTEAFTRFKRHKITDIVFEVNLKYDTNFSTLVVDQESWETGIISVLPLRDEIRRDGVRV